MARDDDDIIADSSEVNGSSTEQKANTATKTAKKGKFIAKFVKSLKGFGLLGSLGIVAIILILVLFIIIGIVGFFLEMPALMNSAISEKKTSFFVELQTWFSGNRAMFGNDTQKELAEYLDNMGYPPYEFGFGKYFDEKGNFIKTEASSATDDENISMNSKYLNAYLTADYNTYEVEDKNKATVAEVLNFVGKQIGYILGNEIEKDTSTPQFGMIVFDGSFWANNKIGFLDSVKSDVETKTLTFKIFNSLGSYRYYTYNTAGWSARYGKPLELSIALHLATMAPDLVYRLDMDGEENTKIHMSVQKYKEMMTLEYHVMSNGETAEKTDTKFSDVDESLKDLDGKNILTVDDLQKLQDFIDEHEKPDWIQDLDDGYSNLKAFINASPGDANNRKYLKDDESLLQRYDGSDLTDILNYDNAIQFFFGDMDDAIEKVKKIDSSAKFYPESQNKESYMKMLGKTRHQLPVAHVNLNGKVEGIMKEYYEKYDSYGKSDMSDDDADKLFAFLQDKLKVFTEAGDDGKSPMERDIEKIKEIEKKEDEKNKKLEEELTKIGLSINSIKKATDYNNKEGDGKGTKITTYQPYITWVEKHWFRDVIFKDTTGEYDNYDAYSKSDSQTSHAEEFNPSSQSDDSALAPNDKGSFYTNETANAGATLVQVKDAIRGKVNEHTKELFAGTDGHPAKYFVYDGSDKTAKKIDELRKIYDDAYSKSWKNSSAIVYTSKERDEKARSYAEQKVEEKEDEDGTNFFKEVDSKKNALTAFSFLENSHSEDADFLLRDLKKLFVDLGYFTKDDLRVSDTHVFQWPLSGYNNEYWPQRRFEKQQKDYGTLIRSKVSSDNIKDGKNADGSERTADQQASGLYEANFNANLKSSGGNKELPIKDNKKNDDKNKDKDKNKDNKDNNDNDEEKNNSSESTTKDEITNPSQIMDGFAEGIEVTSPVTGEILEEGDDYIKIKVLDTSKISEYKEFYEKYKGICTGYTMYIKGFKKEQINKNSKSDYKKVTHTNNYFIQMGYADDYREAKKVAKEYEDKEKKRIDAPAFIEKDGKKYIKEGTVIGKTTSSDIALYFINRDNSIVEDVESYIRLTKKGLDTDFPEKFIFWLGVELEGACEGKYDLGNEYGTETLKDGAGHTTAFGLTKDIISGKVPEMYPQFGTHLAEGRVPKKEAQDVFILVLEADRDAILKRVKNQNSLAENELDALVDLYHASPSKAYNITDLLNSKGSLTVEDFENFWGSNENYEGPLKGRAHVRGTLYTNEEYRNPYIRPAFPEYKFLTDTPWTDFCKGTPSSKIVQ